MKLYIDNELKLISLGMCMFALKALFIRNILFPKLNLSPNNANFEVNDTIRTHWLHSHEHMQDLATLNHAVT